MSEVPRIDWEAFGRAIFRPDQSRYEAVRPIVDRLAKLHTKEAGRRGSDLKSSERVAILTNDHVLREIWEVATSELGAVWAYQDDRRTFLPFLDIRPVSEGLDPEETIEETTKPLRHQSPAPLDLELMVSFLSMPHHVVGAIEEDAMEAARRLRPFELGRAVDRVAWVMQPPVWSWHGYGNAWSTAGLAGSWNEVFRRNEAAWAEAEKCGEIVKKTAINYGVAESAARHAAHDVTAWYAWEWCTGRGLTISPHDYSFGYSSAVFGEPFTKIPNPVDPVLRILGRGVDPIDLRGNAVIIGIPWVHGGGIMSTLSGLRRAMEKKYKIEGRSTAAAVSRKK